MKINVTVQDNLVRSDSLKPGDVWCFDKERTVFYMRVKHGKDNTQYDLQLDDGALMLIEPPDKMLILVRDATLTGSV